ncbi:nucleopolyhedrovirus P10 family protein, partial [Streptomyces sp. WM6378]
MTGDSWSSAVRLRLGLGRLLALGDVRDGAWITERAAVSVLRAASATLPGLAVTSLRLAPADPESRIEPLVPPPPTALPPGPLRITAELAAVGGHPLPELTATLREALFTAADDRLGLPLSDIDLSVT